MDEQRNPIGVAPQPQFAWQLAARNPAQRDLRQTAYRITVFAPSGTSNTPGSVVWDSGRIASSGTIGIVYAGPGLAPHTTYTWTVAVWDQAGRRGLWSTAARFTTGLGREDWQAHWIAAAPDAPQTAGAQPLPVFRREVMVEKPLAQALVFVSGLGQYDLRVDGRPATATVMNPGWTDYRRTIFYNSYDVTALLRKGANALGVLLGNGMYNMTKSPGRYSKFTGSFGQPKLILELYLRYSDGTSQTVGTDDRWTTHPGPVVFSSIYGGEDEDATRDPAGWEQAGFAASGWKPAVEVAGPGGKLLPQIAQPLTVARLYKPVHITEPRPRVLVYDLGQNMSGWPVLTVRGPAGATVTMKPGELLDADGLVTQSNVGGTADAQVLFRYTLRGGGVEHWQPRFSYYGFRYVQVEGATLPTAPRLGQPAVLSLAGAFVHAGVADVGRFESSDVLFDRIHKLIDMAILSNTASILTDCPTREKLGWLEQTYLNGAPLFYNYDMRRLYAAISLNMRDAQLSDGLQPSIAPEYVKFIDERGNNTPFRDSPEWGSAAVLSRWTLYAFGGDREELRAAYPAMQRYVDYLTSRAVDHMLNYGLGDWYDIGPAPPGESQLTGRSVTATATYYEDLTVLAQAATVLGHAADAARYAAQAEAVREAFNRRLFSPETNRYDRGSQTAEAMPLALGMVPAGHEAAVLANLIADIRRHDDHVTAGDIGFHYVVRALTDAGRSDVLAAMLSRTDSPSYGYQLAHGATTLTEAWDTNRSDSQDHFMLGHGEEWFYRGLAGIRFSFADPVSVIRLEPAFPKGIAHAEASYDSVLGPIESSWMRHGRNVEWNASIPPGSTARVMFQGLEADSALEAGSGRRLIHENKCAVEASVLTCTFGSGHYSFSAQTAPSRHSGDFD